MLKDVIFENISDIILIVNEDAVIIDISASVLGLFKYTREELIGESFQQLLPHNYRAGHKGMFQAFIQNPVPRSMGNGKILYGLDKHGNELPINIVLSSFSKNNRKYFVAIIRDASQLINYQNKLEALNKQLITKNKELDQFAHIVAHDLKSPVNNLFGLIDMIKTDYGKDLEPELRDYFSYIEQTTTNLSNLIEGILKYSISGNGYVDNSAFKLKDLIREVLDNLSIPRGFTTTVECPEVKIKTNKTQLFQVLTNLIENSVKHHNKETGCIKISCVSSPDLVKIEIEDDGPGIKEVYQNKIFQLFGKGHARNRSDSTGIGLATVRKLVRQNGGTIKLKSAYGKGSKFTFKWICSS